MLKKNISQFSRKEFLENLPNRKCKNVQEIGNTKGMYLVGIYVYTKKKSDNVAFFKHHNSKHEAVVLKARIN